MVLLKKTDYNIKITELENKIPIVSNLVKKTDYDTNITDIENKLTDHKHDKYIDTSKFNTLAANVFNTRIAQANLIRKTDLDATLSSPNRKITSNNDLSYYRGKNYFDEDGKLNHYVFQPLFKYLEVSHIGNTTHILSWKFKGLHDTKIKTIATNNYLIQE